MASRHRDRRGARPQAVEVAIGSGVEGAGEGEGDAEAGGGGGGGRAGRIGERGTVRREVGAAKLDGGVGSLGDEMKRDPADVMLRGVGVRNFLADVDLDVEGDAGLRGRGCGDDGNVFFRLPVGGLDGRSECRIHVESFHR